MSDEDLSNEKSRGRPKGSLNKKNMIIAERIEALGCEHPAEALARIAKEAEGRYKRVLYALGDEFSEGEFLDEDQAAHYARAMESARTELRIAVTCQKTLLSYVAPKQKSVQIEIEEKPMQPSSVTRRIIDIDDKGQIIEQDLAKIIKNEAQ